MQYKNIVLKEIEISCNVHGVENKFAFVLYLKAAENHDKQFLKYEKTL